MIRAAAVLLMLAAPLRAQQTATFLDFHTTVPAGWTTRAPSSSSRLAEYIVPAAQGAPSAEVVVYFFGTRTPPNVEANVERWRDQFTNGDSKPTFERVARDSSATFPTTFAEFHGAYRRGIGAGSADSVRTGQALIAAIVDTPKGTLFIQLFGPEARVVAQRDAFSIFVTGLK